MPTLYCLCQMHPDNENIGRPDDQHYGAPNRYCVWNPSCQETSGQGATPFPPLALSTRMRVIKAGAVQVILKEHKRNLWDEAPRPSGYHKHYPNVDVHECQHCFARVAVEGR